MHTDADITIRPATSGDAPAIAGIIRALGWLPYLDDEPAVETEERMARHLEMCRADDSHTVLVAQASSGEAVGYIATHWIPHLMLKGPEGYISELFVRESERGKGIGKRLIESIRQQARERGCSRLHLVTGRHRDAYRIYQKLGWTERPEIGNFILPLDM